MHAKQKTTELVAFYTLVQVAWMVAEVHQSAVSIVLNQTARNARRFFGLEDSAP